MKQFIVEYLWYDEENGFDRCGQHTVRTLNELSKWLNDQPTTENIRIVNIKPTEQKVKYKSYYDKKESR